MDFYLSVYESENNDLCNVHNIDYLPSEHFDKIFPVFGENFKL